MPETPTATPHTRTIKSMGGGWTEQEKISLLIQMIDQAGQPKWSEMKLPEGRTVKACMHVLAKMRQTAKGMQQGTPVTPTTSSAAKGRKRKVEDMVSDMADAEDDEEPDNTPTKPTKTASSNKTIKVKEEEIFEWPN